MGLYLGGLIYGEVRYCVREMEQLLKPVRFDGDRTKSDGSEWIHWRKTFENFLDAATVSDDSKKLQILVNFLSSDVYQHISQCSTYTESIDTLQAFYVRPKNEIFARHILLTRLQDASESISDYLQVL